MKTQDLILKRLKEVMSFPETEANNAIIIELRHLVMQSMGMDKHSLDQLLCFVKEA